MTMRKLTNLERDYVKMVAKRSVTEQEALDFLEGLEAHNESTITVVYDIHENGFLVNKTKRFNTMREVVRFIKKVQSITKPIIKED